MGRHTWWVAVFADGSVNRSCTRAACPAHEPTTILGPAAARLVDQYDTLGGHLFHMVTLPHANPTVQKALGAVDCPACVPNPGVHPNDPKLYCSTCGGSGLVMRSDLGWPVSWRVLPRATN
jgi:hypothetical protein